MPKGVGEYAMTSGAHLSTVCSGPYRPLRADGDDHGREHRLQEGKAGCNFVIIGVVFRVGAYIPVPGVDPAALAEIFKQNAGGIAGLLDVFSGGSIGRMSVLALSIMPYISASIIMQILTTVVPSLEALKKLARLLNKTSQSNQNLQSMRQWLDFVI